MAYGDRPFYKIYNFKFPGEDNTGGYGFSIDLEPKFARKILDISLSEEEYTVFQEDAVRIIKHFGGDPKGLSSVAYKFHNRDEKPTGILKSFDVPGDSCGFDIDSDGLSDLKTGASIDDVIKYEPHNVDSFSQESLLNLLWMRWADWADKQVINWDK